MIIVSDTTAISNLIRIGELELLRVMYGKVFLPRAVFEELLVLEKRGIPIVSIMREDFFELIDVEENDLYHELSVNLDKGEAEAIVLALRINADLLLIDEVKGRQIASQKSLSVIGTIGILIEAKRRKLISSVQEKMDDLRTIGFWIGQGLYAKVVELEKEVK